MAGGAGHAQPGDDEEDAEIADINVTPLVDITLVLLIIMMVAAPLITSNPAIKVDLPKASSGEESPKTPILLTLRKDGTIYYGAQPISEPEAQRRVKADYERDPETSAVIDADKGVPYGSVIRLIDLVKGQGVTRFALNIDATP
jgi:biopolymer transport protein ExbD